MRSASSAVDEAPGEDELLGPRRTDEPGEALRAAGAGDDAEQDLRLAEPGVVAGDAQVAAQRELAAATERVAGDRGDRRLGDAGHGGERGLQRGRAVDHLLVGPGGHLLDVGAGREHLRDRRRRPPRGRRRAVVASYAAPRISCCTWADRAFIGGRSSRIVPTPVLDLELHELAHAGLLAPGSPARGPRPSLTAMPDRRRPRACARVRRRDRARRSGAGPGSAGPAASARAGRQTVPLPARPGRGQGRQG